MVIGANPTDGHPVFASRMKRRLREGAKLIVVEPRRIDLVRTPHIEADYHLPLARDERRGHQRPRPCYRHRGSVHERTVCERCDWEEFQKWKEFVSMSASIPEAVEKITGVPAEHIRGAARLYATGGNAAIYYGLGVTEHSQGSTMVMAIANLAMATGNIGARGVGVNPLRGQNNVQGSCDMGSFPHELSGYRHISEDATRAMFETEWGPTRSEPGLRIPNMIDAAFDGTFKGIYIQGEDFLQSDPNTQHMSAGLAVNGTIRRAGLVPGRNRALRSGVPARFYLPREERHLY